MLKSQKSKRSSLNTLPPWGGFRTLTEFIINTVQEKANAIIQEHNTILASKKDQEIFFDAFMKPKGPNEKLRATAERYKQFMQENK